MDPDTCERGCLCCLETSRVISALKYKKLFRPVILGASQNDSSHNDATMYAVTVNVAPTKFMNRKQWRRYSPVEQTAQLTRIEAAFRRNNPSVVLKEIHFETCPVVKNIHFHALYEMPALFKAELETYYNRICDSTDSNTTTPWRHLDIQPVRDLTAWLQYIRKTVV